MHKLSYYTIFSDELNAKNDSIIFCSRTGKAFLVSKSIRAHLVQGAFNQLPVDVLEKLIEAKGIVSIDEDELTLIREENKQHIASASASSLYVVIQPSANCQLGCYYCGQKHTKDSLSNGTVDRIVDRVASKLKSGDYRRLHIGWFGAEPLMGLAQIRTLSAAFRKTTEELGIAYSSKVVTNGLSLKPQIYRELVQDLKVVSMEVTLDGTADSHDKHRYMKTGGKSFDLIYKNLCDIFNLPDYDQLCPISIRCNVDKNNWDDVSNLISKMASDGFQKKVSYFYTTGVYSWGQNDAHKGSLTKEDFAEKEIDWLIELMEAGFNPKVLPSRQKQVCAAVNPDFEMYDAYGNVFNCTEVSYADSYVGTPYVLGTLIDPDNISQDRLLVNWNDEIAEEGRFPCNTCKMLPVCGGACPKSWHEDMRACPPAKFNIKEKLALAYIQSKTDLTVLA